MLSIQTNTMAMLLSEFDFLPIYRADLAGSRTLSFGSSTLVQTESVSHVGIVIHQTLKSSNAVNARIQKGCASLFSILSIERHTSLVSPLLLLSIFIKVCHPTLLYGAELWHCLTINDINKLERFLRLAAKYIQKLPTRTRTDIALGMLGWISISARVDLRKVGWLVVFDLTAL